MFIAVPVTAAAAAVAGPSGPLRRAQMTVGLPGWQLLWKARAEITTSARRVDATGRVGKVNDMNFVRGQHF
ncbi:MAG: hypothetical protein PVJ57_03545 [Phycisphaerae bacterium]|jgi:hypothetical protein